MSSTHLVSCARVTVPIPSLGSPRAVAYKSALPNINGALPHLKRN